jgi:hypothetical protein
MGGVNVLTENGSMEISRIVKQRERVRVACADPTTGRVEYQPVTDWFCRCAAPGELLRIETFARTGEDGERGSHRAIRCTRNHEFYTPTGKIPAASLKVGDTVLTPGTRVLAWQEQLLLGGLMGDTYMALRATAATGASGWTVVHGHKQRTYLDWKFSLLRNLGVGEPRTQKLGKGGFAKQPTSRFTLRAHAVTSKMCLDFYAGGTKEPPPGIVQRMGWYGLGIWFGDDGSCVCPKASNKISSLRFHTCAFSRESVERLRDELIAFTGLPWLCRLQNGRYPILVLGNGDGTQNNKGTDNIRRFSDMLAPYLPPMLGYKLRRNDCGSAWAGLTPPQGTWLEPTQIKSIAEYTPAPHEDYLVYDITVENRHNYVVHGVLVSNSQILRDARMIRGQARPEYWARYMAGDAPPVPTVSATHQKFMNMLRAAGINPVNEGTQTHLMAMTDKDIDALAGERNLENAETVDWADMAPIKGGLFDQKLTGGHASSKDGGNTWSAIKLHEPYPSPVMEEPIRKILGLTEPKFLAILSGKEDLNGKRGPAAIGDALLTGKLDFLRVEDGSYQVLDFKTGRAYADWDEPKQGDADRIKLHKYRQQLVFYKLLLEHSSRYKLPVGTLALEFVESIVGKDEPITLLYEPSEEEIDRMKKLIQAVHGKIVSLDFPDVSKYENNLKGILAFEDDLISGDV